MSNLSDLVKYITFTKQELIKLPNPFNLGNDPDADTSFDNQDLSPPSTPPGTTYSPVPDEYKVYIDAEGFITGTQKTPMDLGIQPYEGKGGGQYVDKRLLQSNHPDEYDNMHKRNPDLPPAYGGIVIDDDGKILMRKVTNDFDGMTWSLAKGKQDKDDEDELATATREVGEEMGIDVEIAGEIPGWYNTDNSTSKYFLMRMTKNNNKPDEPAHDWETEKIEWVDLQEALKRLNGNKNTKASDRDRDAILAAMHSQQSAEKPPEIDAKVETETSSFSSFFDDFMKDFEEAEAHDEVPMTVHMSNLGKEFAKNGSLPSDLATNPKYTQLRTAIFLMSSTMHSDEKIPQGFKGDRKLAEEIKKLRGTVIPQGPLGAHVNLDDPGFMGHILHELDKSFDAKGHNFSTQQDVNGDQNYNFKYMWTSIFFANSGSRGWYGSASHDCPEANLMQEIVGEMQNAPHNFRFGQVIPEDLDHLGNPRHLTENKRNELIETYEAWKDGDIEAQGEFSWGQKYNFEDDTPVYVKTASQVPGFHTSVQQGLHVANQEVNGWEHSYNSSVAAKAARERQGSGWATDKNANLRNITRRYGRNYLKAQGKHPEEDPSAIGHSSDEPEFEDYTETEIAEYEAGQEMMRQLVRTMNTTQSQMLKAAFGPGVQGQFLWRQTAEAREIVGDINVIKEEGTDEDKMEYLKALASDKVTGDLFKGSMEKPNSPATAVHVHSSPVVGATHRLFGYGNTQGPPPDNFHYGKWVNFDDILSHTSFAPWQMDDSNFESEKETLYMHNPGDVSYITYNSGEGDADQQTRDFWTKSFFDMYDGSAIPKGFTRLNPERHGFTKPDEDYKDILVPATSQDNESLGTVAGVEIGSHNPKGKFGSNNGLTMKDPKTGKLYYVKTEDAAKNKAEILSNKIYQMAGIAVPNTELVKFNGTASTKSEWLPEAESVKDFDHPDLTNGFLVDVMLNNWDVMGMNNDNVISSGGKVYRVDNGGSLHFSSAGGNTKMKGFHKDEWYEPSGPQFTSANPEGFTKEDFPYLPTIAAMQNPAYPAGKVFGNMSTEQYKGAAKSLLNLSNGKIKRLVNESGLAADDRKGYEADKMVQSLIDRRDSIIEWLINEKPGVLEGKSLSDIHDQHSLLKMEFLFKEDDDRTEEFRLPHIYVSTPAHQAEAHRGGDKKS